MITMEFEELQKIWDAQNNQPLYVINEEALHNRIRSKVKQGRHIANISELLLIIANFGAGGFVFGMGLFKQRSNIFIYVMVAWMFATALYSLISRLRRIKSDDRFDRSMQGDLDHAVSMAKYQVRLSQKMRWNTLAIGAFSALSVWESGKPFWIIGLILVFFAFVWYASGWENRIYETRMRELEALQKKLEAKDEGMVQ